MATYQTPNVYVEEQSVLPPSVAPVSTAVPAFIGYTAKADPGIGQPYRISSLLDFETYFGAAETTSFTATENSDGTVTVADPAPGYRLYPCLKMYFDNGGGPCYITSVGLYADPATVTLADLENNGLTPLISEDEPTLIVCPDALALIDSDYHEYCQKALAHCGTLQDRFAILDARDEADDSTNGVLAGFRTGLGTSYLDYGAAYYPDLSTNMTFSFTDQSVTVTPWDHSGGTAGTAVALAELKTSNTGLYNKVYSALNAQRRVLPPSASVAGVYAVTDRERGVWKAPANVSLASVIGPVKKINDNQQEGLNVDATSGKSINAIRAFAGKGTLIWGARTLDGNSNEWRYVSVRRLFNYIEESVKKSTAWAVFEPNTMTTWLKVKTMIASFLTDIWRDGGLAGATTDDAFFVHIGLGTTMTEDDIDNGKMIVKVGIAAARPAEFIILTFTHKLQESQ